MTDKALIQWPHGLAIQALSVDFLLMDDPRDVFEEHPRQVFNGAIVRVIFTNGQSLEYTTPREETIQQFQREDMMSPIYSPSTLQMFARYAAGAYERKYGNG